MDKTQQNERRAIMIEKVRKVLNMAKDSGGNDNEKQAALATANKLMADYGIAEADCDISILDANEMDFGEVEVGPDGTIPQQGKVYRSFPTWTGVLAVGIARFTDSIVVRKTTANGQILVFQGEKNDVLFARWMFTVLVESIQREQKQSGWTNRTDSTAFRSAAASSLANRLRTLATERQAIYRQAQATSNSKALMVVERKGAEIAKYFGRQHVKHTYSGVTRSGASVAGREAGSRINIPSAPPIGSAGTSRRAIA
jgi:hypothetical protein